MDTLSLDSDTWDLTLNSAGNVAIKTGADAEAQDAASAIRTFEGEVYYDTTLGIPYWTRILGSLPPLSYLKSQFEQAALSVPGIVSAKCFISSFTNREVTGQVQIVDENGESAAVNF